MDNVKKQWIKIIADGLAKAAEGKGIALGDIEQRVIVERPPRAEMGDLAFPMFPFAKDFRGCPPNDCGTGGGRPW